MPNTETRKRKAPAKKAATERFPIKNRWTGVVHARKSSPRSKDAVRARVVHTDAQKRRLDLFVTEPVYRKLGWEVGSRVSAEFATASGRFLVRIAPSHFGLKLSLPNLTSGTVRIPISSAPIANGLCAGVREVSFELQGSALVASLPMDWARCHGVDPDAAVAEREAA